MSDHWETFPCQLGEHTAWITYDHGVRETINAAQFSYCARFKVVLQSPDDRGLPKSDEFERLNNVEDELLRQIESLGGIQVGRVTTNGARHFIFYTNADEAQVGDIADRTAASSRYQILSKHEADAEKSAYWNQLFPTDDDWQVINDMRVERALAEKGDKLDQPRPIEHWAYFKTQADRESFIQQVNDRFNTIQKFDAPDSPKGNFGVKLMHVGLPDYRSMNAFTIALAREARRYDGEYDGWETEVRHG